GAQAALEARERDELRLVRALGRHYGVANVVVGAVAGQGLQGAKRVEALVLHLRQVARDAAVVANEAFLLGLGRLDRGVVHLGAGRLPTRRRDATAQGLFVLRLQKVGLHAHVEVAPRKRNAQRQRAGVAVRIDGVRLEGVEPTLEAEDFTPAVEARAVFVGRLEHRAHATIASGEETLEPAVADLVGLER